jgi:hypothetical protein
VAEVGAAIGILRARVPDAAVAAVGRIALLFEPVPGAIDSTYFAVRTIPIGAAGISAGIAIGRRGGIPTIRCRFAIGITSVEECTVGCRVGLRRRTGLRGIRLAGGSADDGGHREDCGDPFDSERMHDGLLAEMECERR